MATTLRIDSFNEINVIERSELAADAAEGASELLLRSTQGIIDGQVIYVGHLSREGIEKASVASVDDETTVTLSAPLKLAHKAYEPVTAVLGDKIHIYRAVNVTDMVPDPEAFTVLVTREIDPDQMSTYYRDSAGSSGYWYRFTYFNESTLAETDLLELPAVRGETAPHYASVREIREAAGFQNAYNLSDSRVELWRRTAEAEINAALAGAYVIPFDPVPEIVHALTIQLAAALLEDDAYHSTTTAKKIKDARAALKDYQLGSIAVTDDQGIDLGTSETISGWPNESVPRYFRMEDRF
ncbi:phage gp36-like protein [Pseudarthrobacter oxydans]|uniref:Phage gp36-like protein n=1 Tax=Pseudarthrobacter oxydans TaxID=1671 RepID=A0AAW8NHZ3_PSEOX|nr:phage protein Gp36 family protein [Pseudarthrobacter oxydans]MDR6794734.1 phage gp36-like protein [Pseudarthrobacter oxydans]MDR7166064.1 phage gp36-like protein [Pseudarthrobacter oxydans]